MRCCRLVLSHAMPSLLMAALLLAHGTLLGQAAPASFPPDASGPGAPIVRPAAEPPPPPPVVYDPSIFQKPVSKDQIADLAKFAGQPSGDAYNDKQLHKLIRQMIPDCIFRYGKDMQLPEAMDMVFNGSRVPVVLREGRYLMLSGDRGPYLEGRGFFWIDLQEGVALGGFYFHPTNGEPTPTVAVFSRQIKEDKQAVLSLAELPPAFAVDLRDWAANTRVPPLTTRYFLTGNNKRILLQHDEDFCNLPGGQQDCQAMNADAADMDLTAAYYLEQTNHATNATAYMINGDAQTEFIALRTNTCGGGPDPLGCRIRLTHERIRVVVHHGTPPRGPAPVSHGPSHPHE